jgi:hypothetical protein
MFQVRPVLLREWIEVFDEVIRELVDHMRQIVSLDLARPNFGTRDVSAKMIFKAPAALLVFSSSEFTDNPRIAYPEESPQLD